ncbi:MAG TPA: GDSL-type esterase/lipase family protein [Pseudonocardiaceae bacterium]|jgi:lysophospholipase L1-like esterase
MVQTKEQTATTAKPARRRRGRLWLRELRSWPTVLVLVLCLFAGIPLVVALTPDQQLQVLGQNIGVGAQEPQLSLSGPAQLVQTGNTRLDLRELQVFGPLRPRLSLGPVQRNAAAARILDPNTSRQAQSDAVHTLADGYLHWYLWGAVGVLAFALATSATIGCLRMLVVLRRDSRAGREYVTVAEVWQGCSGAIGRMTVLAVAVSVLAWGACGQLAYSGTTRGLAHITSLSGLVGDTEISPSPVGPAVYGYSGAVIGDSRAARVGGPPLVHRTRDDTACERSRDSLAAELTSMLPSRKVLNLACTGASVAQGLRGPQQRGDVQLAPQVGRLKRVQGLDFVVVVIGPNDVNWGDFLRYCYGAATCDDRLVDGEFGYRMSQFDQDYAGLLRDLDELPGHPKVVIMTSYDAFASGATDRCPDVRGPDGVVGLDQRKIELLDNRNDQLNAVLTAGAEKYHFAVAHPDLTLLCGKDADGLGPDLQGLKDKNPFHPTGVGSLRLAAAVVEVLH